MLAAPCWQWCERLLQRVTALRTHKVLAQHKSIHPGICRVAIISHEVYALHKHTQTTAGGTKGWRMRCAQGAGMTLRNHASHAATETCSA